MGKRQDQASITKIKIINSAKDLIKTKGIEDVSVDEITKRAGVAKGSFYVHFEKKTDIINEIGYIELKQLYDDVLKLSNNRLIEKVDYFYYRYKEIFISLGVEICKCLLQNNLNCRCRLEYDLNAIKLILNNSNDELKEEVNINKLSNYIISQIYGINLMWIMSDGNTEFLDDFDASKILKPYLKEQK